MSAFYRISTMGQSYLQTCYGFQIKVFKNEQKQDGLLQSLVTMRNLGEWNVAWVVNKTGLSYVSQHSDR